MQIEAGQIGLQSTPNLAVRPASIRGTQSFLATIAECWKRPSLLGLELLWRWGFGIPALALLGWEAYKILSSVSLAGTGIGHFSLIDSVTAAQIISATLDVLLPPVREVARWLLPVLALAWALTSGFGRSLVLRKYDRTLRSAPWLMVALQLLRIVVLGASVALWLVCLHWAAWSSLSGPSPDLVVYFIKAIVLSFAIFFFWAVVSWIFSIAPLLALLENTGIVASLRNSLRFGHGSLRGLRSKLVEINLVLGIVKAALVVLAMVSCATPVPFKEEINGTSLYVWWGLVTVAYLAASDFFQVARIIGFIEIWRAANDKSHPVIVTMA
ncbi:MAG: hypothetical protein RB191_18140 [Terriglobia bacterium]|nr:hypothetical protein [Terriglobia bacterium]